MKASGMVGSANRRGVCGLGAEGKLLKRLHFVSLEVEVKAKVSTRVERCLIISKLSISMKERMQIRQI